MTPAERRAAWEAVEKTTDEDARIQAASALVKAGEHDDELAVRILADLNQVLKRRAIGRGIL